MVSMISLRRLAVNIVTSVQVVVTRLIMISEPVEACFKEQIKAGTVNELLRSLN